MSNKDDFDFYEAGLVKGTELFEDCLNIVVGKGNLNADIMFVGEAPGKKEDELGLPFVGAGGKNLDRLLLRVGLTLDDIYVANILKCRPPENRDPTPSEMIAHTPWLLKQVREVRPKVICTLGNFSTKFFLALGDVSLMKKMPGITQVHGVARDIMFPIRNEDGGIDKISLRLIPLFHPAAIIYNRTKLTPLWEADMEVVKKEVGKV
ncbi:MAG: uracil-DNA glycosylase family 4 [Patescibacteria group bacterium]|jgi:uracil-DNA glycosylase family 4